MTTVAEIERLRALVERLLPLSGRRPGEVFSAADWNTVVGALLEVARAVVEEEGGAVPAHAHPDQVTLGWLDPGLRALIERGPLDDPAAVGRVSALERGLAALQQRLDALARHLRDVRKVTDRVETSDLTRESTITRLSRKLDGMADTREDLSALRRTLDTVRADVTVVGTFAESFGDVTATDVTGRLNKVDELTERLTTPSGALLDVAELERRLTELRTTLVTEEELDAALADVRPELPRSVLENLLEQSRAAALAEVQRGNAALSERLSAQITDRLAAVEDTATETAARVARESADSLRTELSTTLREELSGIVREGDEGVRAELKLALDASRGTLEQVLEERFAALARDVDTGVKESLEGLRPDLERQVAQQVAGGLRELSARLAQYDRQLEEMRGSLAAVSTDVARLREQHGTDLSRLNRDLRVDLTGSLRLAVEELTLAQTKLGEQLRGEIAVERLRLDRLGRNRPPDGGVIGPVGDPDADDPPVPTPSIG